MSKILLDYNPISGISEYMHFDADSESVRIVREQDVSNVLEFTKANANDKDFSRAALKSDQFHYARLPWEVEEQMKAKHHVWWEDKNDTEHRKFFSVLNEHYPAFKMTAWKHE